MDVYTEQVALQVAQRIVSSKSLVGDCLRAEVTDSDTDNEEEGSGGDAEESLSFFILFSSLSLAPFMLFHSQIECVFYIFFSLHERENTNKLWS